MDPNAGTEGLDCGASWKEKQGGQRTANQEELASIQEEAERTVTWSEAVNTNMRVEGVNRESQKAPAKKEHNTAMGLARPSS